jgi:hypothetical protein
MCLVGWTWCGAQSVTFAPRIASALGIYMNARPDAAFSYVQPHSLRVYGSITLTSREVSGFTLL